MDCNNYNQYYSDTLDSSGNFDPSKCFKGSEIYPKMKDFAINNYKDYKGKDYYNFINENLGEYSFPSNYADLTFNDICNSKDYSLKPQQKFAGRVFNTHVENRGILIYHGLGSGKTQTSIVIGEAFKFRKVNGQPINTVPVQGEPYNSRSPTHVLVVVPASLTEQYFSEIIGFIESGEIKSATGQILINEERQFYLDKKIRKSLDVYNTNINRITSIMESLSPDNPKYTEYQNQLIQFNKDILFLKQEENKKVNKVYEILSHERFLNQLYNISAGPFTPGDYLAKLNSPNVPKYRI
jgi:N12 class adenine-specific DNA methylase